MDAPPHGRLDTGQRYVRATVWTIVHFLLWAVLFVAALTLVPYYVDRFESFNTDLPVMTIMVIDFSRWVQNYWYIAVLAGLVGLTLDWLILATLGKVGWIRVMIVGVLLALPPLLMGAIGYLGIWLANLKLAQNLI